MLALYLVIGLIKTNGGLIEPIGHSLWTLLQNIGERKKIHIYIYTHIYISWCYAVLSHSVMSDSL